MKVEVIGPGCKRCHKVHEVMVTASEELQTDANQYADVFVTYENL